MVAILLRRFVEICSHPSKTATSASLSFSVFLRDADSFDQSLLRLLKKD
jgi:hypothetical protein